MLNKLSGWSRITLVFSGLWVAGALGMAGYGGLREAEARHENRMACLGRSIPAETCQAAHTVMAADHWAYMGTLFAVFMLPLPIFLGLIWGGVKTTAWVRQGFQQKGNTDHM